LKFLYVQHTQKLKPSIHYISILGQVALFAKSRKASSIAR
jgi:hypothetical protein